MTPKPGHYWCEQCDDVAFGPTCTPDHTVHFVPQTPRKPRAEMAAAAFADMRQAAADAPDFSKMTAAEITGYNQLKPPV